MVTGGASGMGLAMAVAFASAGADVAIGSLLAGGRKAEGEVVHMPGQEQMDQARSLIEAEGVECLAMNLDVTSNESVEEFYQGHGRSLRQGRRAGQCRRNNRREHDQRPFGRAVGQGHRRQPHRDLSGHQAGSAGDDRAEVGPDHQHRLDRGHSRRRHLRCILRLQGRSGWPDPCVALEGAPHGVTCNAISPTWVDTSFAREWMTDIAEKQEHRTGDEYVADVKKSNPQGRLISPTEIGALALFLCTDGAQGITMEDLRVSAGSFW